MKPLRRRRLWVYMKEATTYAAIIFLSCLSAAWLLLKRLWEKKK